MASAEPAGASRRGLPLLWFVVPMLIAVAALAIGEGTDLDRAVTRLFYDGQARAFPLRHTFLLEVVMHHWTKYAVATVGFVMLGGFGLSFVLPPLRAYRRVFLFLVLAISLAPLSVTAGKAVSSRHCPWDVDEFGGLVPYTGVFESNASGVEPGRCFPAGHASTGFALMAFYFAAFALQRRRLARIALLSPLAAGFVLGMGRVAQGAHFVTHVVWAGLFCWTVMVVLYALVLRPRASPVETGLPPSANGQGEPLAQAEARPAGIPGP